MYLIYALLLGFVAGLRALTAPAAASWGAYFGWLAVSRTPLAFMGYRFTPLVFSVLAIGELINDKLPTTPSRKVPPSFIARIVMGSLAGATLGAAYDGLLPGVVAGAIGAVAGTLGGAAMRGALARMFGKDLPAALLEDTMAILLGLFAVTRG